MIYIAAPFGNHIHPKNTTSVMGTFTVDPRPGLIQQIIKTLRYSFKDKCWYNSLGLRNPGIEKGYDKWLKKDNRILSVTAIEPNDWNTLNMIIPKDTPLELNISCPNVTHFKDFLKGLPQFQPRNPILKLSPHMKSEVLDYLLDEGFTHFHASNTYRTDKGARSGKFLEPYTIMTIEYLRNKLGDKGRLIAGGGITHIEDIRRYEQAGADDFSLGTVCFNPYRLYKLLDALEVN